MNTETGRQLNLIVDPYNYRDRLKQPKLILLGTNDRYWPLEALNLYWDGLEGEKRVVYVPNQGHGLADMGRVLGGIAALHRQSAGLLTLPELTWNIKDVTDGIELQLTSTPAPVATSAWTATAATRDFRDATWSSQPLAADGKAFSHHLVTPAQGFAALFGEAEYEQDGLKYYLSTNVRITPPLPAAKPAP